MSSPAEKIKILCPPLYADTERDEYISMAESLTGRAYFGVHGDQAVALRACHLYTLSKRSQGAGGTVASMAEGKLSMSFNSGNMGGDDLSQTHFGIQLKSLGRMVGPAISVNEGIFG